VSVGISREGDFQSGRNVFRGKCKRKKKGKDKRKTKVKKVSEQNGGKNINVNWCMAVNTREEKTVIEGVGVGFGTTKRPLQRPVLCSIP
jgi:hypothetical protein